MSTNTSRPFRNLWAYWVGYSCKFLISPSSSDRSKITIWSVKNKCVRQNWRIITELQALLLLSDRHVIFIHSWISRANNGGQHELAYSLDFRHALSHVRSGRWGRNYGKFRRHPCKKLSPDGCLNSFLVALHEEWSAKRCKDCSQHFIRHWVLSGSLNHHPPDNWLRGRLQRGFGEERGLLYRTAAGNRV